MVVMEDSLPSKFNVKCKGQTRRASMVNTCPMSCEVRSRRLNSLGMLGGQAWLTQVPCIVRLVPEKFVDTHFGAMSLGGSW